MDVHVLVFLSCIEMESEGGPFFERYARGGALAQGAHLRDYGCVMPPENDDMYGFARFMF
jgi:hypothetical protein